MKIPRWIWTGGWGLPGKWLEGQVRSAYPNVDHTVIPPTPGLLAAVDWQSYDRACGYSLGSFLLLRNADMIKTPALLLAPFFAYPSEAGLGGRIRRAQIRYLSRWLQRDAPAALSDFHERAGLQLPRPMALPYELGDLLWGLEQLATESVPPSLPHGWTGVIGESDALLDACVIAAADSRIQTVPGAGHSPGLLLKHAAEATP